MHSYEPFFDKSIEEAANPGILETAPLFLYPGFSLWWFLPLEKKAATDVGDFAWEL